MSCMGGIPPCTTPSRCLWFDLGLSRQAYPQTVTLYWGAYDGVRDVGHRLTATGNTWWLSSRSPGHGGFVFVSIALSR